MPSTDRPDPSGSRQGGAGKAGCPIPAPSQAGFQLSPRLHLQWFWRAGLGPVGASAWPPRSHDLPPGAQAGSPASPAPQP